MNLNHVLAFHKVAAAGGFTVAARLGGVSQPTLSAQVRALERTMGAPLFERSGRRIRLTPAGESLFAATARLSETIEAVADVVARDRTAVRGGLRISADSAIHVIPVLADLKRRVKGLAFSLRIDNSSNVIAQVLNEEADVGVMARQVSDPRLFAIKISGGQAHAAGQRRRCVGQADAHLHSRPCRPGSCRARARLDHARGG